MRYPVFYGIKPKLSMLNVDNLSHGNYQGRILLQTKRGGPVVIAQHKETGIWMVGYGFSTVLFGTKEEALAYCEGRFFDLDGQVV